MKFKRIYIEITNICNLKCPFCSPMLRKKEQMSVENFEKILTQIKKYSPHIYLHVKGEPLTHTHLDELLNLTEKYNFPVNITTNGTILAEKSDLIFAHKNIRQVNISVHSLKAQHGDENLYLKEIAKFGIKALNLKYPYVSYRMWNGQENQTISETAKKQLETISNAFDVSLEDKELLKGRCAAKLGENIFISFEEEFEWPSLTLPEVSHQGKCLGGGDMLAILVDGTVVPCCLDADGIINLGNIFEEKLDDILTSSRYQNLYKGFHGGNISEELCRKCSYRTRFDKHKK